MYLDYIHALCSNSFRQNKTQLEQKGLQSSNPVTFSTHGVGLKSDNFFFWESGACFLIKLINIFCRGSENLKNQEISLT